MLWDRSSKSIRKNIEDLANKVDENHKDTDKRLDNIEKVLIAQELNLKTHMRRSDHLEEIVEELKTRQESEKDARSAEIAPIQKHINMVEGVFKFLGLLGIVVTIMGGLVKLVGLV